MPDNKHFWLGKYPVLHEDHHADLEARAAIHEFKDRHPRDRAEGLAHADYLKERAYDAAAHHLLGLRAAHAAGHGEAARQHGEAYVGAMKHAGHNAFEAPPQEVLNRIKDLPTKVYTYKAHPADAYFAPEASTEAGSDKKPDTSTRDLLDRLKSLRQQVSGS